MNLKKLKQRQLAMSLCDLALDRQGAVAEQWIRAFLRKESGAAIGKDEFTRDFVVYFPQPGDKPAPEIRVFTYDGDTPQDARRAIRERANVVLTNPDMLHAGVLPHHTKWAKAFENLKYIVIDELHYYRGVYGSHLANVMRRLLRICEFYGSKPQFICCSATIANPKELAEALTGQPFELVDRNGAPSGEKYVVFYNPPVVNKQLGIRRSYLNETRRMARELLERGQQTLVFANSRLATEVLLTYLKDDFPGVRGYRGGYLPKERREIERQLREGDIRAVVATNALELGIDIGSLDAVVMAGYPGTIASTWQRAGRAGRRQTAALAVLVASSAPLDQYIIEHPEYFFERPPENAQINPDNLEILLNHLKCAAFELPIRDGEAFGRHDTSDMCRFLADQKLLHQSGKAWHWTSDSYPADAISLRSVSSDNFVVVDITGDHQVIAEVAYTAALTTLHEKAIYLHDARQYQVERFDFTGRKAYVRRVDSDYYTDAIDYTQVTILDRFAQDPRGVALHESFGAIVAQVAEVSLGPDRAVRVHRVVCAVDCGFVVNPNLVAQQMESAVVFGLAPALRAARSDLTAVIKGSAAPAGGRAPVLVLSSVATWQAYNSWGGKNVYASNSSGAITASGTKAAAVVSFDRPYALARGAGHLLHYEVQLARWAEREGRDVEYATDIDLARHPELLANRKLIEFSRSRRTFSTATLSLA